MVVKIEMFNGRGVNSEHFMGLFAKLIPYVLQWNALDFLRAKLVGANSPPGETTILVSSGIVYDGIFQVLFNQDTLIQWLFQPRKVFLNARCSVNNWSIKDA